MKSELNRNIGLLALSATGICSMLGASVYIVPFMIHRSIPGIGDQVLFAFLIAALPAIFAALSYAALGSALPEAGGSYIYVSKGMNKFLGFIASFSQWFGLSIIIGIVSYLAIPFIRDMTFALGWSEAGQILSLGKIRVLLSLFLVWGFVFINLKGNTFYEKTLIPLMLLMFGMGCLVIFWGLYFDHSDFLRATQISTPPQMVTTPSLPVIFGAASILFASFIGFDSIAQAGGEAKNPSTNIPLAIGLTILVVGSFYYLFTYSVYHAVPWSYIAERAAEEDITAPGLLAPLLSPFMGALIIGGAGIALVNDIPAMLLSVSRLTFAWSFDGIFPEVFSKVGNKSKTPTNALLLSGTMASIGIIGSHFAGDFFLGIDIMVTAMMINFTLMCITLLLIDERQPQIAAQIKIFKTTTGRKIIGAIGLFLMMIFLGIHLYKDMVVSKQIWYLKSTPTYLFVMGLGTAIYFYKTKIKSTIKHDL